MFTRRQIKFISGLKHGNDIKALEVLIKGTHRNCACRTGAENSHYDYDRAEVKPKLGSSPTQRTKRPTFFAIARCERIIALSRTPMEADPGDQGHRPMLAWGFRGNWHPTVEQ
ncbi:uncharacterized protein KD926_002260 [Aspergillus affinis]|uniref:uncharacterized protein n=1 Tax=Aspergillus affinis TaxID=1070780 RepID=UPI0022FDE51F|nr:uncharacterized protein KD926_002260 [Aspergillus affinis]KAI9036119.1 hypothetical protein KD926_002260 [Aspergillus affinis]